jgi:hypothetical protein
VALWNGYLLALVVTSVFTGEHSQPMPLFTAPHEFFWYLCRPLWELFFPAATETFPASFLLGLVLWELGAVALGLACYGAGLLVHTLSPHGRGKDGQQQRQSLAKEEVRAMPGERGRRASRWWFWAFPLAGFCYFGAGFAIGLLLDSFEPVPTWLRPLALIMWPLDYFDEHLFGAVCNVLGRPANGDVNLIAFLALWEGCWALLGMLAYRVARGRLVKAEAPAVAPEKARRPSKWWFWWAIVAVNVCALSFLLHYQGLWSRPEVWLGLLFWELVAVVLGLACYGVAALIYALRRAQRKGGNESQE